MSITNTIASTYCRKRDNDFQPVNSATKMCSACSHAASDIAFGKQVTLQTYSYDRHKRTVGDVLLPDGTNVNHMLVKDGWCWWYRKYAPEDTRLEGLEKAAREGRKGLWADPHPVPPWEWRKRK